MNDQATTTESCSVHVSMPIEAQMKHVSVAMRFLIRISKTYRRLTRWRVYLNDAPVGVVQLGGTMVFNAGSGHVTLALTGDNRLAQLAVRHAWMGGNHFETEAELEPGESARFIVKNGSLTKY